MTSQEQDALQPGTLVMNTYRVERMISASGGASFLYLVTDVRNGAKAALKELFPKGFAVRDGVWVRQPDDEQGRAVFRQARDMFVSEMTLMQSLAGEHMTPEIHDVLTAGDTVCYVMEYLEGESLHQYLERRGQIRDADVALQMLLPVFRTLIRLHEKNILHRDVSPANIFICEDNSIRLIDFGNARVIETGKSRLIDWAKKGYAPLEQQDAQFRQGPWTDVYALAATAFRMITGEAPPSAKERVVRDEIRFPSEQGILVNPVREQALKQALSVYPDDRYQTMQAFYEAVFPEGATKPLEKEPTVQHTAHPVRSVVAGEGWIQGLDGQFRGMEFPIGEQITFGRGSGCNIRFAKETPGVSAVHLLVRYDDENRLFRVTDVGSTYGTRKLSGAEIPRNRETGMFEGEGVILGDREIFAFFIKPAGM